MEKLQTELEPKEKLIQQSLFNIPFWKIRITNFEEKKKELVQLLEFYPEKKIGMQEFSTNRQSERSDMIKRFVSIMTEEVELFTKHLKKDFAIHEMWSISYDKDDEQWPHNHGSWGLTGILYLDLPKGSPVSDYIQPWNDYESDTVQFHAPDVVEGDIVIVPSFILHFSRPNKSEKTKRIISWDMKILSDEHGIYKR